MSSISSGTTTGTGLVHTSDTSGDLVLKTGSSATTAMTISGSTQAITLSSATLSQPTGAMPLFLARAWVKFNGTGTPAINASGNVSSITDNGTGAYRVNFTTAMGSGNFSATGGVNCVASQNNFGMNIHTYLTGSVSLGTTENGADTDKSEVSVTVHI